MSADTPPRVPVLCFGASGLRFAVPVAAVAALDAAAPAAVSLAALLGLEPHAAATRTVTVTGGDRARALVVDAPLLLRVLDVGDVVPAPVALPRNPAVLGFARIDDELVQLLDTERLLAAS
ncbi:MAG: chemotaxis protein CheW [Kofleriaceae bacterium]|nr:chemotaxis protein CheW [Kofleriaceae bacterium]MCL4225318.1 chemotaxis protein CheW [Myxococcales bacterium]